MTHDQTIVIFKKNAGRALATVIILALAGIPALALADGPPPFTFKDRCVPYELDPDFMRANGVDPDKIIDAFIEMETESMPTAVPVTISARSRRGRRMSM